jgi:anti-anti-sigma regulatory factor
MTQENISLGLAGDALVIAPVGHITAVLCPDLKAKILSFLGPDTRARSLHFDFSGCLYMDSTFLGLIVYLAKLSRSAGTGRPIIHRADPQCKSLFRTMGMTVMLDFTEETCKAPDNAEELSVREALSPEFLLDTHKLLSGLSPENEERFRSLTAALEDAAGDAGPESGKE